jgi:hypothetical protein
LLLRLFPYCFSLPGQHGRRCTISACCPNPPRPYNRPRRRGRLRIGADCKDARRIEGRGKEASGGSFARTTGKRAENEERLGDGGIKTCDCLYRSDLFKRVSIATTRASISFPGRTRSIETKPLATDASRQAAHSNAEPRRHRKTWSAVDPDDESEFNAIDIEFFVVKKGSIERMKQIINVFVSRGFLTILLLLQSSSSSSSSVGVVAKGWTDGRRATTNWGNKLAPNGAAASRSC